MDTPKSCKIAATTSSAEAVPAQDSPVFSFISNLSPLQPVKAPQVTQGFPGLNSPPLVFTSPRLNPRSKLASLKRAHPRECGLSSKNTVTDVDSTENQDVQLAAKEVTCDEKGSHSHTSVDHVESPEECTDQFLSDVVDTDLIDPNITTDSFVKKSENLDVPPDAVTGSNESNINCEYQNNARVIDEIAVAPPAIAKETEDESEIKTPIDMSMIESDIKQGDDGISLAPHLKIETEFPAEHASIAEDRKSKTECLKVIQTGTLDQSSNLLSGSAQTEKDKENYAECIEQVLSESVLQDVQNGPEAFQHRGMRRRCLQFEDALQKVRINRPAQNCSDSGFPESLSQETPLNPLDGRQAETVLPMYPKSMSSNKNTPKPSGIGLHLNSIVNSGSDAVVCVRSARRGNLSIWGKKSILLTNPRLSDNSNSSSVSYLAQTASASTDDNAHEIHSSMAASSTTSTLIIKPSKKSVILNPVEDQSTSGNKRNYSETDGDSEDFKSSDKKKRKKLSDVSDGDGCKRCNCKKSRCLKLYCDCFAAGIYCAGPCACHECYNRPEYEDTVLETRQQIESRNPLAFAPRVVQNINEASARASRETGTHFTPSSARHKRGCNCKKSMCLKKYCECYQANVGCSDGCRCEGCKNVFGQKEAYGTIKNVLNEEGASDETFIDQAAASGTALSLNEISDTHNLTPVTPVLQSFNQSKDASESLSQSGKYFQSPESSLSFVAQYMMSPGSPRISDNDMTSEIAREIMDLLPSDQHLFHHKSEPVIHQPGTMPNPQEWTSNSRTSSLQWRGSPNTPIVQISGAKHRQLIELDPELSNITQDDTPDILKDGPNNPGSTVKVTSPNKKRVSPPHRQQEFGSSSSVGGRAVRRFILKAVPSFPPLTPCIDSRSILPQNVEDPENCKDKNK